MKQKADYVKTNNLWKKLTKEQKQYLINKSIDEIEIDIDKDYNVSIVNILKTKMKLIVILKHLEIFIILKKQQYKLIHLI